MAALEAENYAYNLDLLRAFYAAISASILDLATTASVAALDAANYAASLDLLREF